MGKKKTKGKRRQQQQQRRAAKTRRRQGRAKATFDDDALFELPPHLPPVGLEAPCPARLGPAIQLDPSGAVAPDPRQVLGLAEGVSDPESIQKAWRDQLVMHPPEQDPETARQLHEARALLIEPDRVLERMFGRVRPPDPVAWGLSDEVPGSSTAQLDASGRLAGQAVLYALLEDALWDEALASWWNDRRSSRRRRS